MRDHNTGGDYESLMYAGLRTSKTLHKKLCRIGLGLCELRRIPLPRTSVNRRVADAPSAEAWHDGYDHYDWVG